MTNPERKFYVNEQHDLDSIFPPAKVLEYEEEGVEDWVNFFEPLNHFNCFPPIREDSKQTVVNLFLENKHGSKVKIKDTPEGVMVYKRDVAPLLYASLSVFWLSYDFFTDEFKEGLNRIHSGKASNPSSDWKK